MNDYSHLFKTMPFDEAVDLAFKLARQKVKNTIDYRMVLHELESYHYLQISGNFIPWFLDALPDPIDCIHPTIENFNYAMNRFSESDI